MKTRPSPTSADNSLDGYPDAASLAALRAWYEGMTTRQTVTRYLSHAKDVGQSSRGILSGIRRQLVVFAQRRHRTDLATLFEHPASERTRYIRAVTHAIEILPSLPLPTPQISDDITLWFPVRIAHVLQTHGIKTLAALTVRIPRRRRWWTIVPGLGATGARQIEAFFAAHPQLTERARVLVAVESPQDIVPWELLTVPHEVDGSQGAFRAPRATCILRANNDYEAVQAWLALHEATTTQRAYRKEAERLILWAIMEQRLALSSLTTEDAVAYRTFLRHPAPRGRWIGPPRPRSSPEWRPFTGGLSPRSVAYALSVLSALYRWLIQQRYVLANPFAGIKVRGAGKAPALATARAFTEGEWSLIQAVAESIEWSHGWEIAAAQRLRFVLDFAYATGVRSSELAGATLGMIKEDAQGDRWLHMTGKGHKAGKVALPPMARSALDRYLVQRQLPTTLARWSPATPLLGSLERESAVSITGTRLWAVMKKFFLLAADTITQEHPTTAEKLRRASPHWMRHTHATHALQRGVELTTVRDNLRHASLATTSIYLHTDEARRAHQLGQAFGKVRR